MARPKAPLFYGWLDWPEHRAAVARTFRAPTFAAAAPHLMTYGSNRGDVFLYKAFKEVIGKYPDYDAQTIGDCTSQGGAHSGDLTQCLEIALGEAEEFKELSTEALYGMAREVAGMLGSRGDGCYGTAIAKAITQGVVPREVTGPYSGKRAKEWGYSGTPADIKTQAREHPFRDATLITSVDELDVAIDNGYVGFVGSMQGFTMGRDANGVCKPRGSWAHLMALGWARKTIGGVVHYLIAQSWGANVPSGPTPDDMPNFCFYGDERTVGRMLAQRDAAVISGFNGFATEPRPIPDSWKWADLAF